VKEEKTLSKVSSLDEFVGPETEEAPENPSGAFTVKVDDLRKHNIFFATPCYGGVITDQYFLSMFKTSQELMKYGINFRITTLRNESLVTRARNILVAMFLDSDATHLMFIDADIEFDAESVVRMLALDKPIIAGAYPKKVVDWEQVKQAALRGEKDVSTFGAQYAINFKFNDPVTKQLTVDRGAVEVLDASTGFFMIKREVIEKMIQHYPELHYKNDSSIDTRFNKHCYALFDTMIDPEDNRYLSEDYTFCRRWQKMGGKMWIDPSTRLNHVGAFTFAGDLSKILEKGP